MIGTRFKYPNSNKWFKLVKIKGFVYYFECGHWCTDNVFVDLIPEKPIQLKLNL